MLNKESYYVIVSFEGLVILCLVHGIPYCFLIDLDVIFVAVCELDHLGASFQVVGDDGCLESQFKEGKRLSVVSNIMALIDVVRKRFDGFAKVVYDVLEEEFVFVAKR